MRYIDISEWQGTIDFAKVKPNVAGIMLRAGYGKNHIDKRFREYAAECNRLNIPIGAYWFSYAKTTAEAKAEAHYLLEAVKPYRIELPLAYDFEDDSVANAKKSGVIITRSMASEFTFAFCTEIENGGYWCLNYTNPSFIKNYLTDAVVSRFGLWLAQWPVTVNLTKPPRQCAIWQWTSKGSIPGISGNVDIDESYNDFKTVIKAAGLNHLDEHEKADDSEPKESEKEDALKWAKENGITDNETLAKAIYEYHKKFVLK